MPKHFVKSAILILSMVLAYGSITAKATLVQLAVVWSFCEAKNEPCYQSCETFFDHSDREKLVCISGCDHQVRNCVIRIWVPD